MMKNSESGGYGTQEFTLINSYIWHLFIVLL
jgi:hypothetical protein